MLLKSNHHSSTVSGMRDPKAKTADTCPRKSPHGFRELVNLLVRIRADEDTGKSAQGISAEGGWGAAQLFDLITRKKKLALYFMAYEKW